MAACHGNPIPRYCLCTLFEHTQLFAGMVFQLQNLQVAGRLCMALVLPGVLPDFTYVFRRIATYLSSWRATFRACSFCVNANAIVQCRTRCGIPLRSARDTVDFGEGGGMAFERR